MEILLHTARMTDRFDEELAMLADIRAYIRTVEGSAFPISTSVVDRVLDERNADSPGANYPASELEGPDGR